MHVIVRIAGLVLALALPAQAQAQDAPAGADPRARLEIDTNLFCDTRRQVERFVTLLDENGGSAEAAIEQVNAEKEYHEIKRADVPVSRRLRVIETPRFEAPATLVTSEDQQATPAE